MFRKYSKKKVINCSYGLFFKDSKKGKVYPKPHSKYRLGSAGKEIMNFPTTAAYTQNEAKLSAKKIKKKNEEVCMRKISPQSDRTVSSDHAVHPQNEAKVSAQGKDYPQEKFEPTELRVQIEHHLPPKDLFSLQKEYQKRGDSKKLKIKLDVLKLKRIPEEDNALPDVSC